MMTLRTLIQAIHKIADDNDISEMAEVTVYNALSLSEFDIAEVRVSDDGNSIELVVD